MFIKSYESDFKNYSSNRDSKLMWVSSEGGKNYFIDNTKGRSNPHFVKILIDYTFTVGQVDYPQSD